ncbi:hypothetical protein TNCV_2492551 [Trichonephila clavipes]|uniref:Uncharacterized protein n=1 Tax=Trichonephila clavipes TaxID=2585209 RepID=A0A8X6V4K4_TRICX|nr:hypothetical protein TNCV_2492551 [Trichonephila clavipes]
MSRQEEPFLRKLRQPPEEPFLRKLRQPPEEPPSYGHIKIGYEYQTTNPVPVQYRSELQYDILVHLLGEFPYFITSLIARCSFVFTV